jgi:hypothetical protein
MGTWPFSEDPVVELMRVAGQSTVTSLRWYSRHSNSVTFDRSSLSSTKSLVILVYGLSSDEEVSPDHWYPFQSLMFFPIIHNQHIDLSEGQG